jgi:hypothetical protein
MVHTILQKLGNSANASGAIEFLMLQGIFLAVYNFTDCR